MPDPIESFEALLDPDPRDAASVAAALGVSISTVARYARRAADTIAVLGAARATRYARYGDLIGAQAQQPLFWVSETGEATPLATLTFVHGARTHIGARGLDYLSEREALPWFLTPVAQAGFLGRAVAKRFATPPTLFDANPERWSVAQQLFVALQSGIDLPGAILVGEHAVQAWRDNAASRTARADYDALAAQGANGSKAGTSAGGEQPKFTAVRDDGTHVLVKYSPPRGTAHGEIWHTLLTMEHLACETLRASAMVPAAATHLIQIDARTYLESERIDRVGAFGRRHAVALSALHRAFVRGPQQRWPVTARALMQQRRVSEPDARAITIAFRFGKWIANDDMHFGNLSLIAPSPVALKKPRFVLAPIYDMLPMRYRPETNFGDLTYSPFTPDAPMPGEEEADAVARSLAQTFWSRVAQTEGVGASAQSLGETMAQRARAGRYAP
jgi:hypothetical protein